MVLRGIAPALAGLSWAHASGAAAASFDVNVTCPAWTAESVAQVEARIQASLLLDRRSARSVSVRCRDDTVSVEVTTDHGALTRPVERQGRTLEDGVVDAVERALRELEPPAAAVPESPPLDAAAATPVPEPPPPAPATPPAPLTSARPAALRPRKAKQRVVAELQARALVERWSERWTWGAEAGMSVGEPQLQYGLVVAGRVATGEPSSFEVNEWSTAARVQLTPRAALGLRGSLGVGASLFVTTPSRDVTAESGTLLGTAFLELTVSRPVWLGSFAISPLVGARVFSGARRVRVDDAEALKLPLVTPQVSLALLWALPLTGASRQPGSGGGRAASRPLPLAP